MIALLLDHLWQSSIFLGGVGLLTLAFSHNSANVRFWLWFAASAKFLIPFAILAALGTYVLTPITPPLPAPTLVLMEPVAQPFSGPKPVLAMTNLAATPTAPVTTHLDLSFALLALWALGFLAISARWIVRWRQLRLLLRDAVQSLLDAPIAVKFSASRLEPGLVGIFRPVILLPKGIEQQLMPAELNVIVAHELCHWRRRDNLLAAFHMMVEALFWFFPLVWWLGARLNAEREKACDEAVLASGSDPQLYAEGILKVCRIYLQSPLACAAGVSGAGLKKRLDLIMENRFVVRLNLFKKTVLAASATMVVAAPVALGLIASPLLLAPATARSTSIDVATASTPDGAVTPDDAVAIFRDRHYMPPIALKKPPLGKAISLPPEQLDKFSGYYELSPSHAIRFQHNGAYLVIAPATLRGIAPAVLAGNEWFPESPTNFFSNLPMKMRFDSDAQGHVTQLVFYGNGWEQAYKRIDEATAKAMNAALAERLATNEPSRGSEQAMRQIPEISPPRGKAIFLSPEQLDKFSGYYELGPTQVFEVRRNDVFLVITPGPLGLIDGGINGGALLIAPPNFRGVEFFPESPTTFFSNTPVRVRFDMDAQGHVTQLVMYQKGWERPFKRIDEATGRALQAAQARRMAFNTPSPGTEQAVRHQIEAMEKGEPDYNVMIGALAAEERRQAPNAEALMKKWGALKSISSGTPAGGVDIYRVAFEHQGTEWRIALDANGKITALSFQDDLGRGSFRNVW